MTMRDFVREHRDELDKCILARCPNLRPLNDEDRRVLNDESLYLWARREGVRI